MNYKNTVSLICTKTCSRKDDACPRAGWCADEKYLPLINEGPCPLLQFSVEKETEYVPRLTEDDTWAVCGQCRFSEAKNGLVSIEAAYEKHCMDCPVHHYRECLAEQEAEAYSS